MSDASSLDLDGPDFFERTSKDRFNERLLEAQGNDGDEEIVSRMNFNDFYTLDSSEELQKKLEILQEQVIRMESQVNDMQNKLTSRKKRRNLEASLTNMTPEERAEYVKQQAEVPEETPDLDIIYEYMLLLGSSSPNDTNDLSTTDFIKPHADIRKAAFESELVLKQLNLTNLQFTKAENILESNPDDEGETRHCTLHGTSIGNDFSLTFDVNEPSMVMSNVKLNVGFEMQLEIGTILEKAREECDILSFFRVLQHYGLMKRDREAVFEKLVDRFNDTDVHVEVLSPSRLKFEASVKTYLILECKTIIVNDDGYRLDANASSHIQPDISLDIFNPPTDDDESLLLISKINNVFLDMVKRQGLYTATETIVNKILLV